MSNVRYPWQRWLDGTEHTAARGRDFTCTTNAFRIALYNKARGTDRVVAMRTTQIDGTTAVIFKFIDGPTQPQPPATWCARQRSAAPSGDARTCWACPYPPVPCRG